MNQNFRLIAFVVLSFGILFLFNMWLGPKPSPNGAPAPSASATVVPTAAPTGAPGAKPTAVLSASAKALPVPKEAAPAEVVLDTPLYHAVLTNRGASFKSYELKHYKNRSSHQPIDLIETQGDSPKPFALTYDPAGDLAGRNWELVGGGRALTLEKGGKAEIVFRLQSGALTLQKTVRIDADKYLFDVDVKVQATGRGSVPAASLVLEGPSDLGEEEFTGTSSRASGYRCTTYASEHMDTEKPKRSQEGKDIPAPITWAAMADQFYVAALLPDAASGAASARVLRDKHPLTLGQDGKLTVDAQTWVARPQVIFQVPALSTGEGFERRYSLYLGPQEVEALKAVGFRLDKVLDLGMFEFIGYYLLLLLKWFFSWCHNWGVAIILLSVLVKAVLWYPNYISFKHMSLNQKKMAVLQPKLEAIKKKYAGDSKKQNEETMKLYQEANINLTSGCLPMLLQIPIFIALYSALSHAIELRGAPFFLWIQDLSLKDPWYILPLLMGGSMFLQQRMTTQANSMGGSAGQQKFMLWFFPIFLTAISFQWPSGLLLYWVVTNLLSFWQQRMVNEAIQKASK